MANVMQEFFSDRKTSALPAPHIYSNMVDLYRFLLLYKEMRIQRLALEHLLN